MRHSWVLVQTTALSKCGKRGGVRKVISSWINQFSSQMEFDFFLLKPQSHAYHKNPQILLNDMSDNNTAHWNTVHLCNRNLCRWALKRNLFFSLSSVFALCFSAVLLCLWTLETKALVPARVKVESWSILNLASEVRRHPLDLCPNLTAQLKCSGKRKKKKPQRIHVKVPHIAPLSLWREMCSLSPETITLLNRYFNY